MTGSARAGASEEAKAGAFAYDQQAIPSVGVRRTICVENSPTRGTNNFGDEDRYRAEAEKALRQLCVDYRADYTGIDWCYRVGAPCEEIAAAAKELETDLIVISTHNYRWFDHLMNGSDAKRIVRRVSCPILVVPQDS